MISRPDPAPGKLQLGDFEVLREIGRGGMGVVYEARQVSLNRKVALKLLGTGLGMTPHAVQRFRREAEAAARLHHTNIVPVYATGEQDGAHFYAMELVEGPSLSQVLEQLRHAPANQSAGAGSASPEPTTSEPTPSGLARTGPYMEGENTSSASTAGGTSSQLSSDRQYFDTVARMTAEVADALEYAHAHGVIHRDIKPANLLLSADGRLSVNDFGLARVLEQPGMTQTGEFVGTPAYMSPEQVAAGRTPLDHRTDVYSLGATLYEMLTLQRPFAGARRDQVLAQILYKEPVPPRRLNRKVPVDLETICLKCLEKDPDRRYPTAKALADDLRRYLTRFAITAKRAGPVARLIKLTRRHKVVAAAGGIILLLAAVSAVTTWLYHQGQQEISKRSEDIQSARAEADRALAQREAARKVRDIEQRIKEQKFREAYALLETEVAPHLPDDPRLQELRSECSLALSVFTDPPDVDLFWKAADDAGETWKHPGRTPVEKVRLPRGPFRWKLQKPGYEAAEGLGTERYLQHWQTVEGQLTLRVQLDREGTRPEGMVRVPAEVRPGKFYGLSAEGIAWGAFYLDRYEVTNRQFKQFLDQGGYQEKAFWEHPFVKDGAMLTWKEAMALFRDATGRPGPATWELGKYPDGQDEYPVSGVSWYEAAAYAKFAGKALPTIYHWASASGFGVAGEIVPRSNFGHTGAAKAGQYQGLGPVGTYDMAGNVKEWCFNSTSDGKRYILGGAWDEQAYMFAAPDARSPFYRAANCGFRCAKYLPGQEPAPQAFAEAKPALRDPRKEKPMTDAEFAVVRRAYAYDKGELNARVVREAETVHWVRERVEYNGAHGGERAVAYLFLPRQARPPYQPVIYWPGAYSRGARAIAPLDFEGVGFLVRGGRALVWPIYKGTYERRVGPVRGATEAWELQKQQANDLSRAIDYLQTRDDLNTSAIGYFGTSWGASATVGVLAVEDRVKAAVFADGGLVNLPLERPEQDTLHYLPRIKIPVLMLNGEYDQIFDRVDSQEQMFKLLGTPAEHKKHLLYKKGHDATPTPERVKETINWFDRYLGPGDQKGSPAVAPE